MRLACLLLRGTMVVFRLTRPGDFIIDNFQPTAQMARDLAPRLVLDDIAPAEDLRVGNVCRLLVGLAGGVVGCFPHILDSSDSSCLFFFSLTETT